MKDAMTYAHEAGFFSFNVVGWKAEFERLIEAVRADAVADHIRDATKMVAEPVRRPQNCGTGYCSCIECPYEPVKQEPVELMGVKEAIEEGGGFWCSCSGCYESSEGAPPKGATFSKIFQCYLGNGCDECGGLGAVWDNTDYEDMARFMAEQDAAPVQPVKQDPEVFQAREIGEGDWFDVGLDERERITAYINSPHMDYRWLYAAPIGTEHFLRAIAALREGIATCRAEALEEAAEVCDAEVGRFEGYPSSEYKEGRDMGAMVCAALIRGFV